MPELDGFFEAVLATHAAGDEAAEQMQAALGVMASSVGLEPDADAAEIAAELEAKAAAYSDSGLVVAFALSRCAVSIATALEFAAKCDPVVDPGLLEVRCNGDCPVDPGVECPPGAELLREGPAPDGQCEGTCTGDCELPALECQGTCHGICEGDCGIMDGSGCAGWCSGLCTGICRQNAGRPCPGECQGMCTYSPPDAVCDAQAMCSAYDEPVPCEEVCLGTIESPELAAACEPAVAAIANVAAVCTPPGQDWLFQLRPDLDADAQQEFLEWIELFGPAFGDAVAAAGWVEIVAEQSSELRAAGNGVVRAVAEMHTQSPETAEGAGCALGELATVDTILSETDATLTAAIESFIAIESAFGS